MDFFNRCRTCMRKGNPEKEDLIYITKYCILGKSYKDVLLTLSPNMDKTFLTADNCVCENCAETLRRSALLIHKCLMIEKKLKAISSKLGNNIHKDITEKNCIEENISISKEVIIDDALEIFNEETCVSVDSTIAGIINKPLQNDYAKKYFQHDGKKKSADSNTESSISLNSTNLLNISFLDGVKKKYNRVISLNPSDRPILENQLSRLMECGISILNLSRNNEEDGKDVNKRVILVCSKSIKTQNAQKQEPAKEERMRVPRNYTCQTCSENFTSKEEFELHLEIHPPFVCEICGKGYVKRCSLKAHMVTHNDRNSYICEICGKGFKDKCALRVHVRSHRDDKTFQCTQCPKLFKQKVDVVNHMKLVHERSMTSQCPECGMLFTTKQSLKSHVKVVHFKEKPYKCNICQRMFGRLDYLRNHTARHTADGPVTKGRRKDREVPYVPPKDKGNPAPCKFCGLWFADMIRLERHLKSHFKRFKCRFCPLTFAQKCLCVRHEKVLHKGVMSNFFRCNVCWKRLASQEALDEHIKRHNKPRYTCDQCGKKFNRRFVLNHHKLEHSNMSDDEVNKIVYNSLVEASSIADTKPEDLPC